MSIFLIRHGETDSNAARVMQVAETPLSARGVDQADRLARRLADAGITHILASDLERAHMTARSLARTTRAPLELEPLLQERNFGDLRGTAYADLPEDPFAPHFVPAAGESWDVFHDRVAEAWRRVTELAPQVEGHLAVVTHGLVCRAFISRHAQLTPPSASGPVAAPPASFLNTSLTIIRSPAPWIVELLSCTRHLEGDGAEGAPV